jgi:hypothetical protein
MNNLTSEWTSVTVSLSMFDGTISEREEWLISNVGPRNEEWTLVSNFLNWTVNYSFRDPKIATMFMLRWL